jgi:hypothetical protein
MLVMDATFTATNMTVAASVMVPLRMMMLLLLQWGVPVPVLLSLHFF